MSESKRVTAAPEFRKTRSRRRTGKRKFKNNQYTKNHTTQVFENDYSPNIDIDVVDDDDAFSVNTSSVNVNLVSDPVVDISLVNRSPVNVHSDPDFSIGLSVVDDDGPSNLSSSKNREEDDHVIMEENVISSTATDKKVTPNPLIDDTNNGPAITIPKTKEFKMYKGENEIMDMGILNNIIRLLACPECKSTSVLSLMYNRRYGIATECKVICSKCEYDSIFWTSNKVQDGRSFENNQRLIYAMRSIGVGLSSFETFLPLMNLPPPMNQNAYNKQQKTILAAVKSVAEQTMKDAANELKTSNEDVSNTSVSVDGSWQRRGYSSLNGVVTAIGVPNGKVVDVEIMSRYCNTCTCYQHLLKTDPEKYKDILVEHDCQLNHKGSAPAMEMEGALEIFKRSIEKHNLRYTGYLGDGDTKSFIAVENIYPQQKVEKLECIGHVQKRVGRRLRELKKNVKGLGGKGRLTKTMIDRMQNYYGIAIRRSCGKNVATMKKAIWGAFFHVASSAKNEWHDHCDPGPDSWCKYQVDLALKTNSYKPGKGLPLDVISHIKPIIIDLSRDDLLLKCLHGKTQNANESFNGTIWNRVPKHTYVGLRLLEMGVYDAIANFNIGRKASVLVYEKLLISVRKL